MTSFHSYTFTLELQSVKEFNIVKKEKRNQNTLLKKNTEQWRYMKTGSEIIFSEKRNHFFIRLPARESGDARPAAPSVPTKTPLTPPAALTHSRAADLPSASTHTYTHTEFRHCICLLTPPHTDTARTWKFNRTHTQEF